MQCAGALVRRFLTWTLSRQHKFFLTNGGNHPLERRDLFKGALAASLLGAPQLPAQATPAADIVIERPVPGTPHQGKVLALITPHLDDGPFFAAGTVAKLLREGYTGYFIRTSNDEKDSYDLTLGETVLANERDTAASSRRRV